MSTATGSSSINVSTQKADVIAEYTALISGLNTVLTTVDTVNIDGVPWKKTDLIAEFQKRIDTAQATAAARSALMTCVAAEHTVAVTVDPLRGGTKQFLKGLLGKKSPTLQKFGFTPDRTPVITPAARAAAVAKGLATKKERGLIDKPKAAPTAPPGSPTAAAPVETAAPAAAPAAPPAPTTKS